MSGSNEIGWMICTNKLGVKTREEKGYRLPAPPRLGFVLIGRMVNYEPRHMVEIWCKPHDLHLMSTDLISKENSVTNKSYYIVYFFSNL